MVENTINQKNPLANEVNPIFSSVSFISAKIRSNDLRQYVC